jgi:hypothetical protein
MHEQVLTDYFLGRVPAELLTQELSGVVPQTDSSLQTSVDMVDDFEVRSEHLVRLCEDVLAAGASSNPPQLLERPSSGGPASPIDWRPARHTM